MKAARAIWSSSTKAANYRKSPENKAADEKEVLLLQASPFSQSCTSSNLQKNTCFEGNYSGLCLPIFIQGTCFRINFLPLASATENSTSLNHQAWTAIQKKKPLSHSLPSSLQGSRIVINATRLIPCSSVSPSHSGGHLALCGLILSPQSPHQVTCKMPQVALELFSSRTWGQHCWCGALMGTSKRGDGAQHCMWEWHLAQQCKSTGWTQLVILLNRCLHEPSLHF